jgi:hypothetical protein
MVDYRRKTSTSNEDPWDLVVYCDSCESHAMSADDIRHAATCAPDGEPHFTTFRSCPECPVKVNARYYHDFPLWHYYDCPRSVDRNIVFSDIGPLPGTRLLRGQHAVPDPKASFADGTSVFMDQTATFPGDHASLVGSFGAGPCIIVIVRDSATGRTHVGHIDGGLVA